MKKKVYIFREESRATVYGIGTYVEQLILCLKNSVIDFDIVSLHTEGDKISIIEKDGYNQIDIPQVVYQRQIKSKLYYAKSVSYILRDIIPYDNTLNIFHLNFMTNEFLVIYLKRLFKCKIILIAHYTNWSFEFLGNEKLLGVLMKKKYNNIKADNERYIYKSTKEDIRMIKKCDCFVCVAEHTYKLLDKIAHLENVVVRVINNGIKDVYKKVTIEKRRTLRRKYFLNQDSPIILFAGRLDEVKGVSYIIKAFKKIQVLYPDARLVIAGEGSFSNLLNDSKNHWANIMFTGRLSKRQLYDFYNIADIGVVASLHEEFGLVAIEMMMHELPVIATDTGGLSEIIEDQISGLKISVETVGKKRSINISQLSRKINYLLENPDKARTLGVNARKRFREKYELSIFQKKMIDLYQGL